MAGASGSTAAFELELNDEPSVTDDEVRALLDNVQDFVAEHTGEQWPAPNATASVDGRRCGYRVADDWVIAITL